MYASTIDDFLVAICKQVRTLFFTQVAKLVLCKMYFAKFSKTLNCLSSSCFCYSSKEQAWIAKLFSDQSKTSRGHNWQLEQHSA